MKASAKTQRLTGLALMTGIIIVLQIVASFIKFGPFTITLALAPIIIGAALYGAGAGAYLGGVFGVVRGYAVICLIAAVVPMVYTALDSSVVQTLFADSSMGTFFLNGDSLLSDLFRISSQIDKVMRAMPKVIV